MRVCHVTTVHRAYDTRIFYRMCCALAERDCSVSLVAPQTSVGNSQVQMSPSNSTIAQVGRVQRIAIALKAALDEKADVYHFHDPELIGIGLFLKVLRPRAAIVYDVHEDYPAMMLVKYWLPKPLRLLTAWAVRFANLSAGLCLDGIVTADPGVQKEFHQIAGRKTITYYNFPVLTVFTKDREEETENKVDLVYIGGMSERAGTFVLLDALALLAKVGIRPTLRLAGYTDGTRGLARIREGIRTRCLVEQVELRGRIPHAKVPAWIRSGRIGLVTLQPIAKFLKNIPSKMFEYWACGLPVIASDLPPIREFLSDGQNGVLFSPSNARDLARAIRSLIECPNVRKSMGHNGLKQVCDVWNNDQQIESLINFYERICHR